MMPGTTNTIVVADPGWWNPRDLQIGEFSAGWRTGGTARLSVQLPALTSATYGDLLGKWVLAACGPLGYWGGTIEDRPGDIANRTVELNAVDFTGLFDHLITPRTYKQDAGPPGALMLRAIRDSGVADGMWLTDAQADEDGLPVTVEWRGDPVSQVLSSLADTGGGITRLEVTEDWAVNWTYRTAPDDRRADLLLVDGHNCVDGSARPSIANLVNRLLGIANDSAWQKASGVWVADGGSIDAYGERQGIKRYAGHTKPSSLEAVARADLKTLAKPTGAVTLLVPLNDPIVQELREGQVVTYWGGVTNGVYDLTITGRAYDTSTRALTVTGNAVVRS